MSSMLVIVSKSVFEKAHTRTLGLGDVFGTSTYASEHKKLQTLTRDDALFLVTVRPGDRLWLIGKLSKPRKAKSGWKSKSANTLPIIDISALRAKLRFDNGKGMSQKPGALGMSLQTPRVLNKEDILLITKAVASDSAKPRDLQGDLQRAMSLFLGRPFARMSTKVQYATYTWSDYLCDTEFGFLKSPDFRKLRALPKPKSARWSQVTGDADDDCHPDFDYARSFVINDDWLNDSDVAEDLSRVELGESYIPGALYGALTHGVESGTDYLGVVARHRCDGSLEDAFRSALKLQPPCGWLSLEDGAIPSSHWQEKLTRIQDARLREHISTFCLDAESARCYGGETAEREEIEHQLDSIKGVKFVCGWNFGEGQASTAIYALSGKAATSSWTLPKSVIARPRRQTKAKKAHGPSRPISIPEVATYDRENGPGFEWMNVALDSEGRKHGPCCEWDLNGFLHGLSQFEHGVRTENINYHPDGSIASRFTAATNVTTFYRSLLPSPEAWDTRVGDTVHVVERTGLAQLTMSGANYRFFDIDGNEVALSGAPLR